SHGRAWDRASQPLALKRRPTRGVPTIGEAGPGTLSCPCGFTPRVTVPLVMIAWAAAGVTAANWTPARKAVRSASFRGVRDIAALLERGLRAPNVGFDGRRGRPWLRDPD